MSNGKQVTIGRPLPGLNLYVLDHHKNPVAAGVTGEIYISGDQMTQGYWNVATTAVSATAFVPNPFSTSPEQKYMYRTGDLGYWTTDMNVCYVGRIDNQVKVRGHRIELEEVERAIFAVSTANVESAAAISIAGPSGETRLVAFVTPKSVSTADIRASLVTLLPSYSRPSRIIAVDALPKSANLKLDRKALAALADGDRDERTEGTRLEEPLEQFTPTEETIAQIWKDLIGLGEADIIRRDDDFLALGGNSLLAIRAARQITSTIGRYIPVVLLIRETVLHCLATAIDQHVAAQDAEGPSAGTFQSYWHSSKRQAHRLEDDGELPLSPLETEMYESIQNSSTKQAFNTTVELKVHGELDIDTLTEAFTRIIWQNPILRARYNVSGQGISRVISEVVTKPRHINGKPKSDELESLINMPFELANEQLIRIDIFDDDSDVLESTTEVVIVTHHLVTDKASLAIMLKLVGDEYRDLVAQRKVKKGAVLENIVPSKRGRPQEKPTYTDWAQWKWLNRDACDIQSQNSGHLSYWRERLESLNPMPWLQNSDGLKNGDQPARLAFDIPRPDSTPHDHCSLQFSQRISVAAVALALRAVYGTPDIVIGLPYLNRDDPATADMLGLFVDRLPLRLSLDDEALSCASSLLGAVTDEINQAVEHYLPYQQIKSVAHAGTLHDGAELVTIMLIYNWQTDALEKSIDLGPDLQVTTKNDGIRPEGLIFPMLIDVSEVEDGSLHVEMEYSTTLFSAELVAQFAKHLSGYIQRLAQGLPLST